MLGQHNSLCGMSCCALPLQNIAYSRHNLGYFYFWSAHQAAPPSLCVCVCVLCVVLFILTAFLALASFDLLQQLLELRPALVCSRFVFYSTLFVFLFSLPFFRNIFGVFLLLYIFTELIFDHTYVCWQSKIVFEIEKLQYKLSSGVSYRVAVIQNNATSLAAHSHMQAHPRTHSDIVVRSLSTSLVLFASLASPALLRALFSQQRHFSFSFLPCAHFSCGICFYFLCLPFSFFWK